MIEEKLEWHIYSKANEVKFDINIVDIHEKKDYLNGNSLEWEIYNVKSKVHPGLSVFKNLVRRWDFDQKKICFQVTAFEVMKEEAEEAVKALKSTLHDKFETNEVLSHFPGQSLLTSSHYATPRSRPWETSPDPELEELINEEKGVNHEGILEPGFVSLLQYQDSGLLNDDSTYGLSTQASKTSSQRNAETIDTTNGSSSDSESGTVQTQHSKGSTATGASETSGVSWDENIKDNAITASSWSHSSKIETKLSEQGFTSQEFVEWKDKNVARIEDIFTNCTHKYKATKQMIRLMAKDRQGLGDKQAQPDT
jgi:hypothetical protein